MISFQYTQIKKKSSLSSVSQSSWQEDKAFQIKQKNRTQEQELNLNMTSSYISTIRPYKRHQKKVKKTFKYISTLN